MTSPGACYEPAEAEQVPRRHLCVCVARGLLNKTPFSNMVNLWDLIGYPYGSKYLLRKCLGYDLGG
jgi:hypothetical protein